MSEPPSDDNSNLARIVDFSSHSLFVDTKCVNFFLELPGYYLNLVKSTIDTLILKINTFVETKKLWICAYGQIRSVSAVCMYGGKSAGICNHYDIENKEGHISKLEEYAIWAEEIYIFDDPFDKHLTNTTEFLKLFPQFKSKVKKTLLIRDQYGEVLHPGLVKEIEKVMFGG